MKNIHPYLYLIIICAVLITAASCTLRKKESRMQEKTELAEASKSTTGPPAVKRIVEATGIPGEVKVSVCVSNYSFKGFAKVVEEVPAGSEAVMIDHGGGTFTVSDGKVKFLFISVPARDVLCMSYKLISPDPKVFVTYPGELVYIDNNEKKAITISPADVEVKGR